MQKENKTVKKFRLQSLLKLHNRVMNDNLAKVVQKGIITLETIAKNNVNKDDALELYKDSLLHFVSCGKHNSEIIKHSQELNTTSSQEELKEFFKHVTGFEVFDYTEKERKECKDSLKDCTVETNMSKKDIETLIDVLTKIVKEK